MPFIDLPDMLIVHSLTFATARTLSIIHSVCHDGKRHAISAEKLIMKLARGKMVVVKALDGENWLQRLHFWDLLQARKPATIASGKSHTVCIRQADKVVFSWGAGHMHGLLGDSLHALGLGDIEGPCVRIPTPIVGMNNVNVREVATGLDHTLLLGSCGRMWSCGGPDAEKEGALGHGFPGYGDSRDSYPGLASPRLIERVMGTHIVQISAGGSHSLALSASGRVYAFGDGEDGSLGLPRSVFPSLINKRVYEPVEVRQLPRVIQVSTGQCHSVALGDKGELYYSGGGAWRYPNEQELLVFQQIAAPTIKMMSAGDYRSLLLSKDGELFLASVERVPRHWDGVNAQQGVRVVEPVQQPADILFRSVATSGGHSAAITEAGEVITFGSNGYGALGHGYTSKPVNQLMTVAALTGKEVVEATCGHGSTTILRLGNGDMFACGSNGHGELGIGDVSEPADAFSGDGRAAAVMVPIQVQMPAAER